MSATSQKSTKRYNLVLPEELRDSLQEVADSKHISVQELVRKFLKLGLLVAQAETTPGVEFLRRVNGREQLVLIL